MISSQFVQNRYKYDLNLSRLLLWILGQDILRDENCIIWAQLFLPPNGVVATDRHNSRTDALSQVENGRIGVSTSGEILRCAQNDSFPFQCVSPELFKEKA
ncbi:hypothetical protein F2Y95_17865 [Aphanizomenon flos-aquae CCAP 1446/1C]|uniref:hypothetical protein n=1 Tax=Anabaena sp. PCC 7938 TaxID=1296340 RepID=UPI0005A815AD|nr:hypothetical protein [Anabaena sp. CCAP 1446/1C]MBY5283556.1 hypothetical protein [Anabaena sp. CCAP 1446/1C]BAY03855.1 hypothetical protein NIES19_31110 [Anabaena cylindrica PCC 7122]